MIIDFGKHAGESIYSVIKCDYGYCRWLAGHTYIVETQRSVDSSNASSDWNDADVVLVS
jgi:hypothetical protein